MNRLDKILTALYCLTLLVAIGTYVVFEFILKIDYAFVYDMPNLQYGLEVGCCALTLAAIYLALKMMKTKLVRRSLAAHTSNYAKWAVIRWLMLSFVIFASEAVYYVFQSTSTWGCPIITAVAFFFVWPTAARRISESTISPDDAKA